MLGLSDADTAAIATIVVAAGTGWLAFSTRGLARQTQKEVGAQFRPVLIDDGVGNIWLQPDLTENDPNGPTVSFAVGVKNVGNGPALNTVVTLSGHVDGEQWNPDPRSVGTFAPSTTANYDIDFAEMKITSDAMATDAPAEFKLEYAYEDLAGKIHTTEFSFGPTLNRPEGERGWRIGLAKTVVPQ